MKEKFELEFLFKTSPRVLENMISTPGGLAEWFADDVNNEDDLYSSRIILFSYGSGFASSMFSIVVSDVNKCQENRFTLRKILNFNQI